MGALGSKLRSLEGGRIAFWCPGCNGAHQVGVNAPTGPNWSFNGDGDSPTLQPSVKVEYNGADAAIDGAPQRLCHSFVTDGGIQFLNDCTHAFAGQTMSLPDWPS